MRILFLLTQDLESPSGLGRYLPMAKGIVKAGHNVHILALHSNYRSITNKKELIDGVEVSYIAPMHVLKTGNEKKYYSLPKLIYLSLLAIYKMTTRSIQLDFDIIHIGKPHPMNSLAGLITGQLKRKKIFLDCDDHEVASGTFSGRWQKSIIDFFERRIPKMVDYVTTNTKANLERVLSYDVSPDRVYLIPNGVELERFRLPTHTEKQDLKKSLNLQDEFIVAYIGTLSKTSHAVDILLEAFQIFNRKNPKSVLLLVGGGEDIEGLKVDVKNGQIEEDVRFCGRISPEEVVKYYAISNVSVDPVRDNEAARGRSPLKLFESWAVGVPFITGDVGDRRTYLGDPPAGLLARAGDADSLAECLEILWKDPELAQRLASQGTERVPHYSWEELSEDLVTVYEQQVAMD